MNQTKRILLVMLLLLSAVAVSISFAQEEGTSDDSGSYIVLTESENSVSPVTLAQIEATGATVTNVVEQVGMVAVRSNNPDMIARLPSVDGITISIRMVNVEPTAPVAGPTVAEVQAVNPPFTADDDSFFDLQYGHDAVDAMEAWAQGYTGQGVRVAVLDEGFDPFHPDLAPNLVGTFNAIPGLDANPEGASDGCAGVADPLTAWQGDGVSCTAITDVVYTLPDPFSHGQHVAGTILAADNAFGSIGVAPDAELLMVKVLSEQIGSGAFDWVIDGIIWATDNDADIINMSLGGGPFDSSDPEVEELIKAMNRATRYARDNGVLVISSAGNDAFDFDANPGQVYLPADSAGVVSIMATSPVGWALSPETGGTHPLGLDGAATYSNFGSNGDFAAPGGDATYPGSETCTVAGLARPCWVFDLVFSTGNGSWYWSAGTSMASPHAAGVAALIWSEKRAMGEDPSPQDIEREMRRRAAQGQPDVDYTNPFYPQLNEAAYFGHGRVDTDYALPSDFLTCQGQPATIYVDSQGHISSPDMAENGKLYTGTLRGTDGPDVIVGTDGADRIRGFDGDDIICGLLGDDDIRGGEGNDSIYGGSTDMGNDPSGADTIRGEGGNDNIWAGNGDDRVWGNDGDDVVRAGSGNDKIYGGEGNDVLNGQNGEDEIRGEGGNDTLWGEAMADRMFGGDGDDNIYGQGGDDLMRGDDGNDTLYGGFPNNPATDTGNDDARGGAGDDVIYGGDGDDTLFGDSGNDTIYGGSTDLAVDPSGVDTIRGGYGDDVIHGGDGDDDLRGSQDNDRVFGGIGNDTIYGEHGADFLDGDTGDDKIFGGDDNDRIYGEAGADDLRGDKGDDLVNGGTGDDMIRGGDGNDELYGGLKANAATETGTGNDDIRGGKGDDMIYGGDGDDTLFGDNGNDTIYGGATDLAVDPSGNDTINGGSGMDTLHGGDGNDDIRGGNDDDRIYGGTGDDMIRGDNGNDFLDGDTGNDTIRSGNGNDSIYGEGGMDMLYGDGGDDLINGQADNDVINGGAGNDELYGGLKANPNNNDGDDDIRGGGGDDAMFGGDGTDSCNGQSGTDTADACEIVNGVP